MVNKTLHSKIIKTFYIDRVTLSTLYYSKIYMVNNLFVQIKIMYIVFNVFGSPNPFHNKFIEPKSKIAFKTFVTALKVSLTF